jgi:hypothetical protein
MDVIRMADAWPWKNRMELILFWHLPGGTEVIHQTPLPRFGWGLN